MKKLKRERKERVNERKSNRAKEVNTEEWEGLIKTEKNLEKRLNEKEKERVLEKLNEKKENSPTDFN